MAEFAADRDSWRETKSKQTLRNARRVASENQPKQN